MYVVRSVFAVLSSHGTVDSISSRHPVHVVLLPVATSTTGKASKITSAPIPYRSLLASVDSPYIQGSQKSGSFLCPCGQNVPTVAIGGLEARSVRWMQYCGRSVEAGGDRSSSVMGAENGQAAGSADGWIAKGKANPDALIDELQKHLETRTFLSGETLTDADVDVGKLLQPKMAESSWTDASRVAKANVWRWFDLVQHSKDEGTPIDFDRDPSEKTIKEAETLAKAAAVPKVSDEERAAKAAAKKAAKEAKKKEKKDKPAPPPQAKKEEDLSVSRLDLRVGKIVKAENHPDADGLYVENIECGDKEPRVVCSGLRKFFATPDLLLGPCVVVCNLKPAKMRGITSQAMVLCATSADGATVELVQPPEGVEVGSRITFEGVTGEPDAQLNPKKQIFEKIAPDLKTNDDCIATWKGKEFTTPNGVCKVKSVKNGGIK